MRDRLRQFWLCGCVLGFAASSAIAADYTMLVVQKNGVNVVPPSATVSAVAGDVLRIEVYLSGWAPHLPQTYQLQISDASLMSGGGGSLELLKTPCTTGADCRSGVSCSGTTMNCTCDNNILVNTTRADFLFFPQQVLAASLCPPEFGDITGFGAVAFMPGPADPGAGAKKYLGEFLLKVGSTACGTFMVRFQNDPDYTFVQNSNAENIPLTVTSTITVNTGMCMASCTALVDADPPPCAIDSRQPHALNNTMPPFGIQHFDLTLNTGCVGSGLGVSSFVRRQVSDVPVGLAPSITSVESLGTNKVRVHLSGPIRARSWFCLRLAGFTTEEFCWGYLPCDVNQDNTCAAPDILGEIDCINNVAPFECGWWNTDVDRSDVEGMGTAQAPDILRIIDLQNGAAMFAPGWRDISIGACPAN